MTSEGMSGRRQVLQNRPRALGHDFLGQKSREVFFGAAVLVFHAHRLVHAEDSAQQKYHHLSFVRTAAKCRVSKG